MKKFFYKAGVFQVLIMLFLHLYNNRNGLPIPNINPESNQLLHLMSTYEIQFFPIGAKHSVDDSLWGYAYTWAAFIIFNFLASLTVLVFKFYSPKVGRYLALANSILWGLATIAALIYWSVPQQVLFGLIFLAFFISFIFEWQTAQPNDTRVAIVGAGISGLTAAFQLQKEGYHNVTLIEKAEKVGGKCLTKVFDNRPYDLGGHEMLAGYTDIMDIAKELNAIDKESIPPLVYDKNNKKYLNFQEAAKVNGGYSMLQVMWASIRYYFLVSFKYRHFAKPSTGYANIPHDLAMPLNEWLEKKNLNALHGILNFVVKVQGYGDFKASAAYLVKFMGPKNWFSLLVSGMGLTHRWPRVFKEGMQNVCERIAATVLDTRLNTHIEKIERTEAQAKGGVKIYFKNNSNPEIFDKIIISTPLDTQKVNFLDLREEEKTLFDKIVNVPCFSTMGHLQGLPAGVVASTPITDAEIAKGDYTGYIKDYRDTDLGFFFSIAPGGVDGKKVKDDIREQLKKSPKYEGVQPAVKEFVFQKKWEYFPHVEPTEVANGYYDKLEGLQGQNNCYYASSMLSFECVGNSSAYAKRLVDEKFKTERTYSARKIKVLLAGLAGGIANFVGGFFVLGFLTKFYESHSSDYNCYKNPAELLPVFLGCVSIGLLTAYVFNKWANIRSTIEGAKGGGIIIGLAALAYAFWRYGMSYLLDGYVAVAVDALANGTLGIFTGAAAGWVLGKFKEEKNKIH